MENIHSKKLQYFMKFSVLLDRSFFFALMLICFTTLAFCVSLYYNARSNAASSYNRKAQSITLSLSTMLDSYFVRILETQKEFMGKNNLSRMDEKTKGKIDMLAHVLDADSVRMVGVLSGDMKLVYSSQRAKSIGLQALFEEHNNDFFHEGGKNFISSPFDCVQGERFIAVMTPFYGDDQKMQGILFYLVDFENMVRLLFKDISLGEFENAWIFDQKYSIISDHSKVIFQDRRIPLDRRRFMTYALAKQNGSSSYLRIFPGGKEEKYVVSFSTIPLVGNTKWVVCVEAPADVVYKDAEGFPVVYSLPLLLFFFLIVVLMVMKRYFGRRYISILENVIVTTRDARKEIESRLAAIMDSFPYVIFETDHEGKFSFLNVAPERISGIDAEKLTNKNFKELIDLNISDPIDEAFERLLKEGIEIRHLRIGMHLPDKNGSTIMSLNASPIYDDKRNITGARGVMHDITERVELEMNLIQSQKMDAVGMVTSGIAHDFNNYLSTMLGYITMLKMKGNDSEDLAALEQAAKNAAKLTGQLMSFSRHDVKDDEENCSDFNKTLSVIVDILKKSLPYSISLKLDVEPDLPMVKTTSAKIDQIVMNLVINARDAMPDGGKITIKAWSTGLSDAYSSKLNLLPGKYVILDVADTGKGLSKETRTRIFEPYFTTKKTGTGLGLATVYAIVKNFGGNILVKSVPEKGTQFVVYIPQAGSPSENKKGMDSRARIRLSEPDKKMNVLIVEDDEPFSQVIARSFESVGYKVFIAINGQEGLQIYKKHEKSIDIIISDVIMEEMNGIEMVREIRKINSQIPVLFITGQKIDEKLQQEIKKLQANILAKPFETAELLKNVNKFFNALKDKKNGKKS